MQSNLVHLSNSSYAICYLYLSLSTSTYLYLSLAIYLYLYPICLIVEMPPRLIVEIRLLFSDNFDSPYSRLATCKQFQDSNPWQFQISACFLMEKKPQHPHSHHPKPKIIQNHEASAACWRSQCWSPLECHHQWAVDGLLPARHHLLWAAWAMPLESPKKNTKSTCLFGEIPTVGG